MFIKQRILTAITKHPKILTFGIGITLTLTFVASIGVYGALPTTGFA